MKHTIFATALIALMALQAQAGILGSGLEDMIADMDDHEVIKVLVVMQGQPDIRTLDKSLHARDVTLAERHRTVVGTLQDAAYNSQAALLRDLDGNKAASGIVGYVPHWIINAVVVTGTVEAVREIAARDDVKIVEPNLEAELIEPVVIKEGPLPRDKGNKGFVTPGITAIQADRVWHELGIDGTGTIVANMDSGVDGSHPALSGRWNGNWVAASAAWQDIANIGSPNFPSDPYVGHGTHVMGTICGATAFDTVGVAPGARWIANNALYSTLENLDNQVIAGFEWLADPDGDPNTSDDVPDVVQNSWGIPAGNGYLPCDSTYWDVIDNCEAAGVVVIFSAGNEGPAPGSLRSPGNRATTPTNNFTVGSTSYNPPFLVSSFSSRGPSQCGGEFEMKPEVVAPGESIYSSIPGGSYGYMDGTSMAGPHVAGVVALMRQAAPDLDVTTIKEILMETAIDLGITGEDNNYGHGIVDAYAAVTTVMGNVGTVSGLVTDDDTGLPLEGVTIHDTRGYTTATTASDGTYSFTILSGDTDFELTLFGYDPATLSATVPGGGALDLDAGLAPMLPAVVSGIVRGPGGTPVAGATVTAQGTPVDAAVSGADGSYTLTLPSSLTASYDLLASAPGLAYSLVNAGLQGDRTIDFDLSLPQEDGFESGGFTTLGWTLTGDASWTAATDQAYEGVYSARTGDIGDGESTELELDFYVQGDGPVTFRVMTDCEVAYDVFEFFVDGQFFESWSGQNDWTHYSADLPTGQHNLRWVYRKDSSTSVGADAAWIDIVSLPGTGHEPVPAIEVGSTTITVTLDAGEAGSTPLDITNLGDGTLEYTISAVLATGDGWVYGEPAAGTVHPGSTIPHSIVFDSTTLPAGTHGGALRIESNDPGTPMSFVGLTLTVTPVSAADGNLPRVATLQGAVPNPFNPMADIKFSVPKQGHVSLRVYDISGRLVRTLVDRPLGPGHHSERWDGRDDAGLGVASGVYYARLVAARETSIKPMTLVR